MEKEEEEGTEKSVTEQALRESRAKFVSITLLFKRTPIRTNMTLKMGGNYPLPGEKMDFNHKKITIKNQNVRNVLPKYIRKP